MGKVQMEFFIHNEDGDVVSKIVFDSLEDIDFFIDRLQEARSEFERRVELEKQKKREKRKRREEIRTNGNVPQEVFDSLKKAEETYNKMPEYLKPVFKPMLDMAKQLVEDAKKGADA